MARRNVVIALAIVAAIAVAMPAVGAPSPIKVAKRALGIAKKANKKAKTARTRATAASAAAANATNLANQGLGLINRPEGVPRAINAASADSAASASQLAGFTRFGRLVRLSPTDGASVAAALAAAPEEPLGSAGPFTFYAKCINDTTATSTEAHILVRTSQNGAIFDGQTDLLDGDPDFLDTDTLEVDRQVEVVTTAAANTAVVDMDEENTTLIAPDLDVVQVLTLAAVKRGTLAGGDGVYGAGDGCLVGLQIAD